MRGPNHKTEPKEPEVWCRCDEALPGTNGPLQHQHTRSGNILYKANDRERVFIPKETR
jgi:hypothetical protein